MEIEEVPDYIVPLDAKVANRISGSLIVTF
jgi:hypothetical protein